MASQETNLHIFHDALGFFTNKTVAFIKSVHPGENIFLNTGYHCKNRIDDIQYLTVKDFLAQKQVRVPERVIFHSYSYSNSQYIRMIRKRFPETPIKFIWVFWSHEYYQLPEFFSSLYRGFSRKFYLRKVFSFHIEHLLQFFKGHVSTPFYTGLAAFKKTFSDIDLMAALIKDDYTFAMKGVEGVEYRFVSYISVTDFPEMKLDFEKQKNEVMIGHSGSPIVNHYEILKYLSDIRYQYPVFVPLSYGKAAYINKLKQAVSQNMPSLNITFQTDYLSKDDYYRKIENVGYFILNSYCQQALGNIFFFLWTGAKVFLRKETSSYLTLKERSFYIFSIDDELSPENMIPLSAEQKKHNHRLVQEMIGHEQVKTAWLDLLRF